MNNNGSYRSRETAISDIARSVSNQAPADPKTDKQAPGLEMQLPEKFTGSKAKKPTPKRLGYKHPAWFARQRPLDGDGDDAA